MMDLRLPTGFFFTLVGLVLTGVGAISPTHARLTDVNVNLYSGLAMLIFGGILLWLSRRAN
jgi:hypothetical protein